MEWGNQIGTTFYFVEVIKSGTPRLYASQEGKIVKAPKGSIFKLGENEALLVSSEFLQVSKQLLNLFVFVLIHPFH